MPNVFEQHVPLISIIVENILKSKLSDQEYPFIDSAPLKEVPKSVLVYIIGGVTFAEVKHIQDLNKKYPECHFIVGGSSQINSKMFFDDYIVNQNND